MKHEGDELKDYKLEAIDTIGDGSCFYHSICAAILPYYSDDAQIRQIVNIPFIDSIEARKQFVDALRHSMATYLDDKYSETDPTIYANTHKAFPVLLTLFASGGDLCADNVEKIRMDSKIVDFYTAIVFKLYHNPSRDRNRASIYEFIAETCVDRNVKVNETDESKFMSTCSLHSDQVENILNKVQIVVNEEGLRLNLADNRLFNMVDTLRGELQTNCKETYQKVIETVFADMCSATERPGSTLNTNGAYHTIVKYIKLLQQIRVGLINALGSKRHIKLKRIQGIKAEQIAGNTHDDPEKNYQRAKNILRSLYNVQTKQHFTDSEIQDLLTTNHTNIQDINKKFYLIGQGQVYASIMGGQDSYNLEDTLKRLYVTNEKGEMIKREDADFEHIISFAQYIFDVNIFIIREVEGMNLLYCSHQFHADNPEEKPCVLIRHAGDNRGGHFETIQVVNTKTQQRDRVFLLKSDIIQRLLILKAPSKEFMDAHNKKKIEDDKRPFFRDGFGVGRYHAQESSSSSSSWDYDEEESVRRFRFGSHTFPLRDMINIPFRGQNKSTYTHNTSTIDPDEPEEKKHTDLRHVGSSDTRDRQIFRVKIEHPEGPSLSSWRSGRPIEAARFVKPLTSEEIAKANEKAKELRRQALKEYNEYA
jgi:hypothetical protein